MNGEVTLFVIGKAVACACVAYVVMTAVCCCYVYLHTDYSKVEGSTLIKIESTVLVSSFWPLVFLYAILKTMKEREKRREKQAD